MGVKKVSVKTIVIEREELRKDLGTKNVEIVNCKNELTQLLNNVQRVD